MNQRAMITGFLAFGAAVFLPACTTIRELPRETRKAEPQGAQYDLCRDLLKAFLKNDSKAFLSLLPEETRKVFTKQHFEATRKSVVDSMGEPLSFQYVTDLELAPFTPHIWKIRFMRKDAKSGKEFTSEALFRIITGTVDHKPVLIGFQFL